MAATVKSLATCIFCKIVKGEIPSYKLVETDLSIAFLDINPISKGHALVVPKYHCEKMHQLPDEYLADAMPVAKKIVQALQTDDLNYNILQNNGRIAHQEVNHVHFHVIPKWKDTDSEGLVVGWPVNALDKDGLVKLQEEIVGKL